MTIEYRVRRVERFIVTRYEDTGPEGSVRQIGGEHDNFDVAYQVGYALARKEQEDLGLMPGDDGVIFPSASLEGATGRATEAYRQAIKTLSGGGPAVRAEDVKLTNDLRGAVGGGDRYFAKGCAPVAAAMDPRYGK